MKRYGVDPTCPKSFPDEKRKWNSFCESLAADGLGTSEHKEEIPADTMEAIYELFSAVGTILSPVGRKIKDTLLTFSHA